MITNEIKVMKNFIKEFNPYYDDEETNNFTYEEIVEIIKDIVKEM